MAKKPASLTSDLLARKGDAGPSSVDPASRVTIVPGQQPNLSGIGAGEGPSRRLYAGLATERPEEMYGQDEEERPRPPEPEIIYTPEEEEGGSRTRLVAGAFVGLALLGGVIIALSLNDGGSGVAPVSPDITALPDETPAPAAPAPVAQAVPAPELRASAEPAEPVAPAAPEPAAASEDAPASITPPAIQPKADAPAVAEPAPKRIAAAEPAAEAPAATPAAMGAYVVQIMALREEAAAKSAWDLLQKKHPTILGGHALDIEKADLGDKGTYYRVRAAGFETKAEAQSACSSLKSAGQDCLVKAR